MVTIYWFVRNDWIASYVQIIGNDEWESWYVIDGMMNSYCDKKITRSCGDTQGQLLSLWRLGHLLGIEIRARFRDLNYVMDKELQQEIREGCNRAEFWNKFQDAVFWGKGGVITSNDRIKQQESALFVMLIMNSIVFFNVCVPGDNSSQESNDTSLTPVFWQYINFLGTYDV